MRAEGGYGAAEEGGWVGAIHAPTQPSFDGTGARP